MRDSEKLASAIHRYVDALGATRPTRLRHTLNHIPMLDYFPTSSSEDGHRSAGHGQGMFLAQQEGRREIRSIGASAVDG
jgi:hypothetical protein